MNCRRGVYSSLAGTLIFKGGVGGGKSAKGGEGGKRGRWDKSRIKLRIVKRERFGEDAGRGYDGEYRKFKERR